MFRKILVPLDGTDAAARALPYAAELARRFAATLLLVDVVPTRDATLAL
ncbi:MAG: universal stress protein, partial [Blastocatellia bacterium]